MIYPIKIISEANQREHWAAKAKRVKAHRKAGWAIIRSLKVMLPVTVLLTRIGVRKLDDDNLAGAFKGLRDGIADGFGVADNDDRIIFVYDQRKGKPKEYAVDISFEQHPNG